MKRIILLSLISANAFATELKLSDLAPKYPTYKTWIQHQDRRNQNTYQSQIAHEYCDKKDAKSESAKRVIKKTPQ